MSHYELLADQDDADQGAGGDDDQQPQLVVEAPPLLLTGLLICRKFWHFHKYTFTPPHPLQTGQELLEILGPVVSTLQVRNISN